VRSASPLEPSRKPLSPSSNYHFRTIQALDDLNESAISLDGDNNLNDASITDNEITDILTRTQKLKSPHSVLNKTFDLTDTMIASRHITKPESRLNTGLAKPSSILGCKSTSSTCSTSSSTGSSSSSNYSSNTKPLAPARTSNLQFQLKLNKFGNSDNNTNNLSNTSTPNSKVNLSKQSGAENLQGKMLYSEVY